VDDDRLLEEQRRFYQARAPEYDDWWQRRGRYDRGDEDRREWDAQVAVVQAALDEFSATGDVLELAGGTGWWTQQLARNASHLTVVDSSTETLALNRARVQRSDVVYLEADLFDWQPSRRYDVVFFSFWLSHVPRPRFDAFWELVRACLKRTGRVFFIDNRTDPHAAPHIKDPYVVEYGPDLHLRRLSDGTEWRVVKVMYEPDELHALLTAAGWTTEIDATRWFLYATARLS
jgi:demethylmenaquinone methyltransferase/2-methoxy-6-polyprenyl-1,4-benzoquinol methylase